MKSTIVKNVFFGVILFVIIGLVYTNIAGKKQDEIFKQDYMKNQQAMQMLQSNQTKESANVLEELILKYPDEYTLYYNLGLAYSAQNNFKKSALNFQKALNIRPALLQDQTFTFKMGESLYHIKEYDTAKTYLSMPVLKEYKEQQTQILHLIEQEIQS